MSDTTTGRYVHLPTGSTTERLRADQPLGADVLQTLASNATLLCREGALRTLWESAGGEVWSTIPLGDVTLFPWDTTAGDGIFTAFCGRFRLRTHGERADYPTLRLHARGRAPSGNALGVVLWQMPSPGYPSDIAGAYASGTITATTVDDLEIDLPVDPRKLGSFAVEDPNERGELVEVSVYVGAWCTSDDDASKALLANLTLYQVEP